jgi:hypothetical protein
VRVTKAERKRWTEASRREGVTLSEWIRRHCDRSAKPHEPEPHRGGLMACSW